MRCNNLLGVVAFCSLLSVGLSLLEGGQRGSLGSVGAGGSRGGNGRNGQMNHSAARSNHGGGGSRPDLSSVGAQRPQMGAGQNHNLQGRPSMGGFGQAGANMARSTQSNNAARSGGIGAAGQRPGMANRPQLQSPGDLRATTRPGFGNDSSIARLPGQRPTFGGIQQPSTHTSLPGQSAGADRPRLGRPGTGDIAGIGNRPGAGSGGQQLRPGDGVRPGSDRPDNRPGRPGDRWPGNAGRPIIGGGDRPWNSGTHPGSDGWSTWHGGNNNSWGQNQNWGWADHNHWNNNWQNQWYDHNVNNHYHDWYHGSWSGNWSNNWYVPPYVGATAWGIAASPSTWGYGSEYYNPYYSEPVATAPSSNYYDYSQPVAVYDYGQQYIQPDYSQQYVAMKPQEQVTPAAVQTTVHAPPSADPPPPSDPGLEQFDAALAAFKTGDYRSTLDRCNEALRTRQKDPVIHEVRALALFAQTDYTAAAAALNALLAMSPGMDWTTLSGLYGNVDDYTRQLRQLEAQCRSKPRDAAAHFVLAYHYLVTGHSEEAIEALRVVVAEQPRDVTAKRMLDALAPSEPSTTIAAAPTPPKPLDGGRPGSTTPIPPQTSPKPETTAKAPEQQTDLVGRWRAAADGTTIELGVDDASQFEWSATPAGGKATKLSGKLLATSDTLVLDSETQGSMVGRVKPIGHDEFRFTLAGSPLDAKGLNFKRIQ